MNFPRMQRICGAIATAAILSSAGAGCSVVGKWSLAQVDPAAAKRDFEFHNLTLQKDGTFYADAMEYGAITTTSGVYTHRDDVLHLRAHGGEEHTYNARFISGGDRLELQEFWQGQRLVAVLERQ